MIAVVIPVHNEEEELAACLRSVTIAALHPALQGEEVMTIVVLNGCTDGSEELARASSAAILVLNEARVGLARHIGCDHAIGHGARWLASTDADTKVAPDWLVQQLSLGALAVCGTVDVEDWSCHGKHALALERHFAATYTAIDGHRHVHGANLGVAAAAYVAAGGFGLLACHEDVALVHSLIANGIEISWSRKPRVVTSARKTARARGGFGDTLMAAVLGSASDRPAPEA